MLSLANCFITYICTHTNVCIHIYIQTHFTHTHIYTCIQTYIHAYAHIYTCTHTQNNICTDANTLYSGVFVSAI